MKVYHKPWVGSQVEYEMGMCKFPRQQLKTDMLSIQEGRLNDIKLPLSILRLHSPDKLKKATNKMRLIKRDDKITETV